MTVVPTAPATPATPLKVARVARGWRQADLARIAGLHRETVSRAETGEPPTLKTARALAHVFGVEVEQLFPADDEAQPGQAAPVPTPADGPGRHASG